MKCQVCQRDKLCFWCVSIGGATVIACINCAVTVGLKILEEVLEVKGEGLETGSSRKGRGLPTLPNSGE